MPHTLLLCPDPLVLDGIVQVLDELGVDDLRTFFSWDDCYAALQEGGPTGSWLILGCQGLIPGGFERLMLTHEALSQASGWLSASLLVEPESAGEQESIQQMLGLSHVIDDPLDTEALQLSVARILFEEFGVETEHYQPAEDEDDAAPPPEMVRETIDPVTEGSLSELSMTRLLYHLYRRNDAGLLQLESNGRYVLVSVLGGRVGRQKNAGGADMAQFQAAFGWSDGSYLFAPRSIASHSFMAFGNELNPVYMGLRKLSLNELAGRLGEYQGRYPALTSLISEHGARFEREAFFEPFCDACDGRRTLDEVIAAVGLPPGDVMPWLYFAIETDLITFLDEPVAADQPIQLRYHVKDADPSWSPKLQLPMTADQREVYLELEYKLEYLETNDPYGVFELEPGCGPEVIKTQFAELIKENHPDVYGGNVHEEIKRLAEEVFLQLKKGYEKLLKAEGGSGRGVSGARSPRPRRSTSQLKVKRTSSSSQPAVGREGPPPKPSLSRPSRAARSSEPSKPASDTPSGSRPASSVSASTLGGPRPSRFRRTARPPRSATPISTSVPAVSRPSTPARKEPEAPAAPPPVLTPSPTSAPPSGASRAARPAEKPGSPGLASSARAASTPEKATGASSRTSSPSVALPRSQKRPAVANRPPRSQPPSRASGPTPRSSGSSRRASSPRGKRPPPPRRGGPSASRPSGARRTPMTLPGGKSRDELRRQFKPDDHFKNGMKYLRAGRHSHAAEAFRMASEMESDNGRYKAHYAWARYLVNGTDRQVMPMLLESSKLEGGERDSFLFLGQISKAKGDEEKALHFFKKVNEIDPSCVEAVREIRLFNMRNQNKPKASSGGGGGDASGEGSIWSKFKEALTKKR